MDLSILSGCRLFAGIPAESLPPLLEHLHAYTRRYDKAQPVYRVGDTAHALCIVLAGSVLHYLCVLLYVLLPVCTF